MSFNLGGYFPELNFPKHFVTSDNAKTTAALTGSAVPAGVYLENKKDGKLQRSAKNLSKLTQKKYYPHGIYRLIYLRWGVN